MPSKTKIPIVKYKCEVCGKLYDKWESRLLRNKSSRLNARQSNTKTCSKKCSDKYKNPNNRNFGVK